MSNGLSSIARVYSLAYGSLVILIEISYAPPWEQGLNNPKERDTIILSHGVSESLFIPKWIAIAETWGICQFRTRDLEKIEWHFP